MKLKVFIGMVRSSNYENELQAVEHSSSGEHGFEKERKRSGKTS